MDTTQQATAGMTAMNIPEQTRPPAVAGRDPFYSSFFAPGALVFDVGANIGAKAAKFLRHGAGRVVCFEPQPHCAETIRRKYAQTPQIVVVEKGLSDREGTMTLSICSQADTISTFSERWKIGRFSDYRWDYETDVTVTTLEAMIQQFGRPAYCKIDVEGYEYEVLSGLKSRIPCVSFEFACECLSDTERCFRYLDSLGYREYNVAVGEEENLALTDWVSSGILLAALGRSSDALLWGDIYARCGTPPTSGLDSLRDAGLWQDGQGTQTQGLKAPEMAIPLQAVAALQRGASPVPLAEIHGFNQRERDTWVTAQAATIPAGSRVLDVGAGTCPYRSLFAHCDYRTHDFMQYEGVKLGGTSRYGQIDYVSDVKSIPAPDGSFDVILCTEVLEHVPEPIQAMREMARLLRPGGRLLVSAPLGSGLHQLPYHYYGGYTPGWYQQFGTAFGLDVQAILPNGGFFKHLAQECARVAWTLPEHGHLHGGDLDALRQLFGEMLPRYLFALDERHAMPQFTVGYHVEAVKSRDVALVQSLIDQDCGGVPLYAEAALACLAVADQAGAHRYYEDACEIDAEHASLANLHFYFQTTGSAK